MPTTRQPHDPFTQPPLQPTSSNPTSLGPTSSLRSQTSQQSLHSNASAASTRARQRNGLFAPSLSRRPTSRSTPRVEDEVLADSDSEQDLPAHQRQRQMQKVRHGSPEGKHSRLKAKEEQDFVNRQPDGSYLLGVSGYGETMAIPMMTVPKSEEEVDQAEVDAHYVAISRQYFTSGKSSKKHEDELEQLRGPLMTRLREQVIQQLEDERWQYEPLDRFQQAIP